MSLGKQIFFDLDGPILDVSEKYYRLYKDIVSEMGCVPVSKTRYWENKRNKIPETVTLNESRLPEELMPIYSDKRKALIETRRYWELDVVWPELFAYMNDSPLHGFITLVTLRVNRQALENELSFLGIRSWFASVLSSGEDQGQRPGAEIKIGMIKQHFQRQVEGWFIGDTETDIRTGQNLGLYCAGVSFGIRTRKILSLESPNCIISNPSGLVTWLKEIEKA